MDLMTLVAKIQIDTNAFEQGISKVKTSFESLKSNFNNTDFSSKMESMGKKVQDVGSKVEQVGKTFAPMSAALTAVGTAGVMSFAEVDKTMSLTNQTMNNSGEQAKMLSDAMKDAASNSVFGMRDASEATLNFARAGLTANEAAAALAPSMNLAAGEGGNLETVSAGLVATINGFGDSFDNTSHYADVFAAACNNSALDVNGLSNAMSIAAPIFSAAGYSVNDAALYMGVMGNAGYEASVSANSLKTGLARLVSPAKEGREMMKQLGIEVTNADGSMKDSVQIQSELHDAFSKLSDSEQLAAASAIFGKNQMAPWLALINTAPNEVMELSTKLDGASKSMTSFDDVLKNNGTSLDEIKERMAQLGISGEAVENAFNTSGGSAELFAEGLHEAADAGVTYDDVCNALGMSMDDLQKAMDETSGTTDEMAKAMQEGFGGSLEKLKSGIDVAVYSLGEALAPTISLVADKIQELVDWFNSLDEGQQQTIATIGLLLAGLGPVLIIGGKLLTGIGQMITTVGKIPGLISKVHSGVTLLPEVIGNVATGITGLISGIPALLSAAAPFLIGGAIIAGIIAAVVLIVKHWDDIKEAAGKLKDAVAEKWNAMKEAVGQKVDEIKNTVGQKWDSIKTTVSEKTEAIKSAISEKWESIKTAVGEKIESMKQAIGQKWDAIKQDVGQKIDAIKSAVSEKWESIKSAVGEKIEAIKSTVSEKWEAIKSAVNEKAEAIKNAVTEKWEAIKTAVTEKTESIKSTVSEKWEAIKTAVNEKAEAIKKSVTEKWDSIKKSVEEKTEAMKKGITDRWEKIKTEVTKKTDDLKNKLSQKWDEIKKRAEDKFKVSSWLSLGKNIVSGIIQGVKSKASELFNTLKNLAKEALEKAKSALKIKSPSKLFANEIGQWIPAGIAEGIESHKDLVTDQLDSFDYSDIKVGADLPQPVMVGGYGDYVPAVQNGNEDLMSIITDALQDLSVIVNIGQERLEGIVYQVIQKRNYRTGGR